MVLWDIIFNYYKNSFLADERGEAGDDKKFNKKLDELETTIKEQDKLIKQLQSQREDDAEIIKASKEFFDVLDEELGDEDYDDEDYDDEDYDDEDYDDEDYDYDYDDDEDYDDEDYDDDEEDYDDEDIEELLGEIEAEEAAREKKEQAKRIRQLEKRVQMAEEMRQNAETKSLLAERDRLLSAACEAAGAVDISNVSKLFVDNLQYDDENEKWIYINQKGEEKSVSDGIREDMPKWAKKAAGTGGSGASETREDKSTMLESQKAKLAQLKKIAEDNPTRPEHMAQFMEEKRALKEMEADTAAAT